MTIQLEDYAPVVGEDTLDELRLLASKLRGRRVRHVNSTAVGGGVAEILNRMVPLMREMGVDTHWDVIKGGEDFYRVTKMMHNALHGHKETFTAQDFEIYQEYNERNLAELSLDGDLFLIHDPQPAGLIAKKARSGGHWAWRCHIDLSVPDPLVWGFLRPIVEKYEAAIFSSPRFTQGLPIRQALVCPSIDPLSDKNRELPPEEVHSIMERLRIPLDKPLVTQVSRFDRLKDPVGVIKAFQLAKNYVSARLLLVGGSATDDPEGAQVLAEVREQAGRDPDVMILELPPTANLEINAIQRASTIVVQKSLKEGFGLTVSEALWKSKPVIAGAVGGIPLQITHKYSGILVHSVEGTAKWIRQLISTPDFARKLGENGREHVRHNFLLTRHLRDYMLTFLSLDYPGKQFVELN